jgi:hypothetical protein
MTRTLATLLALAAFAGFAAAADTATTADAPKAKPYPLDTCIVSGDKLGAMGDAIVVVRDGREIKFCCKGCIKDFDKDPAKFEKKIDEAAAAKTAKTAKPAAVEHGAHHE